MSIHNFAVHWAAYLARELNSTAKQESRMAFGLELLLGEFIKIFCLLGLAWLLGIFPEVLMLTLAAMILRFASGGAHCSEYYRCFIGGTLCFLLLGWIARYINPLLNLENLLLITFFSFLLATAGLWKYAPGDTANKPITGEKEKKKFKTLSLFIAGIYFFLMLIVANIKSMSIFVLPLALGMVEQVFTVTPWGYRFIHWVDRVLSFGKGSEEDEEPAHTGSR